MDSSAVPDTIPDTIPDNIRDRVRVQPGSITFPSARRPRVWILLGGAIAFVCVLIFGFLALLFSLFIAVVAGEQAFILVFQMAALTAMPCFAFVVVGFALGAMRSSTPRPLTIAGPKAAYGGIFPPNPVALETLVLQGIPGRHLTLWSGRTKLAAFVVTTGKRGWTYDSVTWLARQAAANAGVELIDERPEADWRRWETDPVYRGERAFDVRLEDNRKAFPRHHATPPSPAYHTVDLEGMRISVQESIFSHRTIVIDGTYLHFSGRKYPLQSISRADVVFSMHKTKNSRYWRGKLQIVTDGRIKTVVKTQCSQSGGKGAAALRWMAEEIRRQAAVAHPVRDSGSVSDVPDDIVEMVGRHPQTHQTESSR